MERNYDFLLGARIVDIETDSDGTLIAIIVETEKGYRYRITADDPGGCINSAGFCFPFLRVD